MPTRPAAPCPIATCPERRPCPTHEAAIIHERERSGRDAKPPWAAWYHIARWRHPRHGLRALALRRDPICRACQAIGVVAASVDVDHVTPHRGDPALFWSLDNLAGLCDWHHRQKTARGE